MVNLTLTNVVFESEIITNHMRLFVYLTLTNVVFESYNVIISQLFL